VAGSVRGVEANESSSVSLLLALMRCLTTFTHTN
jgi:hypothetical protein